ncbi:hypothetical protein [Chryseolinea lacunae]|uniref:HMA domain-containing protein n=1 Tax=Chryseolinea lacunae TaxID=2801331 RepID=A0ABS1KM18_9BACT|nr:hypothetical protein [Chryseolinea lacunae]MBL0740282.1 hypothetical protein [Chryseolinea lacunae]
MKRLRMLSLSLVAMFAALFVYANVRQLSATEKLKSVHFASFTWGSDVTPVTKLSLHQKINSVPGVTACSISQEGTGAAVIFYPDQVTETQLATLLATTTHLAVSQKELPTSGGCPVHNLDASFHRFISALDIRH